MCYLDFHLQYSLSGISENQGAEEADSSITDRINRVESTFFLFKININAIISWPLMR